MSDVLLSVRQVAETLGVTTETVRAYIANGRVAATRLPGGYYRVSAAEVERITRPVRAKR